MIKDYLRSPSYYKRKYIDQLLVKKLTPSMKIGTVVDVKLTGGNHGFKVDSKGSTTENNVIGPGDYAKAEVMANAVLATDIWKTVKKRAKFQVILTGEIDGTAVCGKPDVLWFPRPDDDKHVILWDVKTARESAAKSARSFEYQAYDLGYFIQMAMYEELLFQNGIQTDGMGFLVIGLGMDNVPMVRLCKVHPDATKKGMELIKNALAGIRSRQFTDPEPNWGDAPYIGVPSQVAEGDDGGESEDDDSSPV